MATTTTIIDPRVTVLRLVYADDAHDRFLTYGAVTHPIEGNARVVKILNDMAQNDCFGDDSSPWILDGMDNKGDIHQDWMLSWKGVAYFSGVLSAAGVELEARELW